MLALLAWFRLRLIRDSSSRGSWTLTLSVPAVILLTFWFVLGGIKLDLPGGLSITTATKGGSDYALALAPWLTFIAQRGWRNKDAAPGEPPA